MNDIFKLFKKRSQSGKTANLNEILQEFNDKDLQNNASNFDRSNQKYISISKSGRVKSKKSHHTNRVLKEELFEPNQQQQTLNQQAQLVSQQPQQPAASVNTKNIPTQNSTISAGTSANYKSSAYNHYNFNPTVNRYNTKQQNVYDQHSDNADSSRTSSASQSSIEDFNSQPINSYNVQPPQQQQQQRSSYNLPYSATRKQYY
jgi:hypothetical protein